MDKFIRFAQGVNLDPLPKVGTGPDGGESAIQTILTLFWMVFGAICLLVITIAGFRFVLSRGEPQSVNKAKNAIIYAAIGLVVSVSATIIVGFVFNNI